MRNLLNPTIEEPNFKKLETMFLNSLEYFIKAYITWTQSFPINYKLENEINDEIYNYLLTECQKNTDETLLCPIAQFYDPRQRSRSFSRASQVDFVINWSPNPNYVDYQFYIECKRLSNNDKNYAYINNGINRYETGFYSPKMPFAAMVGYLENGNINTIIDDLNLKLQNRYNRLNKWQCIENISNDENYFWKSIHYRDDLNSNIKLFHLFLDFRDCQNKNIIGMASNIFENRI